VRSSRQNPFVRGPDKGRGYFFFDVRFRGRVMLITIDTIDKRFSPVHVS